MLTKRFVPSPARGRRGRGGFTLLELAVVVLMVGLAASWALPQLAGASGKLRLEGARQAFIGDLQLARAEAIRRNRPVTLTRTGSDSYRIEFMGDRRLDAGATFATGSADSIRFAAFGPVSTGPANFQMQIGATTKGVRVSASGHASEQ